MKRTAPDKRLSSDPVMPHEATVRFRPLHVCRFDPCVFPDCDLMHVCPRVFHDCAFCSCANAWVMCRSMKWSAHASCAAAHAVFVADGGVTVLVLAYGHDHKHEQHEHEQLLKSDVRSNLHVLSG